MPSRKNPEPVPPDEAILVIIRGNSGSGKSTVAREVRDRFGRGCALVEQDYLRRILLREWDGRDSGGIAPQLIGNTVRFALEHGYHVILEGFLWTVRYADMLHDLLDRHTGPSHVFYLDVSFDETVRRHATRPQADEFTPEQMSTWYEHFDVLGIDGERVIPESSTLDRTVEEIVRVMRPTALVDRSARTA
ncbi:MAG TPA: AAA family ATPase [Micromonosporaceae bacterium]